MNSRHRAREIALQILYQYDLNALASGKVPPTDLALVADLRHHFDHFSVPESLREFAAELVAGTLANLAKLDSELEKHASNWKVARMSSVDRSLLRMATFEMTRMGSVPETVVIDEAIELAKAFGTEDTPSFVNGVLDAIKVANLKTEA
ncbi:MAG: transcription antitermination factor NusB [Bdellovibrio sp.]|nr:transcription antitermination factor NusB [Bdellovibrio sp.]